MEIRKDVLVILNDGEILAKPEKQNFTLFEGIIMVGTRVVIFVVKMDTLLVYVVCVTVSGHLV